MDCLLLGFGETVAEGQQISLNKAYGKICKAGSNAKTVELALFMPHAILVVIACHASQKVSLAI